MEPNVFDMTILHWLDQYVQVSASFNHIVKHVSLNNAFKGFPLMLAFWYLWFSDAPGEYRKRRMLMVTLVGAFLAMAVAMAVNFSMPFKVRPYVNDELGLTPLLGLPEKSHTGLFFVSSFPSDTSALFFAISMGLFYVSRRIGGIALLYTLVVIALPRVYLRLHYPTDIIAGAAIGIASVAFCHWVDEKLRYGDWMEMLLRRLPALSHALLFFVSYQIIDLFYTLRLIAGGLAKVL